MSYFSGSIGVLIFCLVFFSMPSNFPYLSSRPRPFREVFHPQTLHRVDFIGTLFLFATTVLFVTALQEGGSEYAWRSAFIITLLVMSLVISLSFFIWERHTSFSVSPRESIFPWRLMTNRYTIGTVMYARLPSTSLLC